MPRWEPGKLHRLRVVLPEAKSLREKSGVVPANRTPGAEVSGKSAKHLNPPDTIRDSEKLLFKAAAFAAAKVEAAAREEPTRPL